MDLIGWQIITHWWKVRETKKGEKWRKMAGWGGWMELSPLVKDEDIQKMEFSPSHITTEKQKHIKSWFFTVIPVYFSLSSFTSHSHNHINIYFFIVSVISRETWKETYLALATSIVSVKRKRCLSWIWRPVFSWVWKWPRNRRPGHSARKAWTRWLDSGLTGVRQLSLGDKTHTTYTQSEYATTDAQRRKLVWMYLQECLWSTGCSTAQRLLEKDLAASWSIFKELCEKTQNPWMLLNYLC